MLTTAVTFKKATRTQLAAFPTGLNSLWQRLPSKVPANRESHAVMEYGGNVRYERKDSPIYSRFFASPAARQRLIGIPLRGRSR